MFKALIVVALILLGVAAFCYRPATIIGVHGDALAHSLGGGDFLNSSRCRDEGQGRWRCSVANHGTGDDAGAVGYVVQTRSFGCWDAIRQQDHQPPGGGFPMRDSGCINLVDVVSPF